MNDVDLVLAMVEAWNAVTDEDEIEAMDRVLVLVRTNDEYEEREQLKAALAMALAQKRETDNENLQLRAQLDPDGPAQALTQVVGMQTFTTKPGEAAPKFRPCTVCNALVGMPFCSACMGSGVVPE